ncbi:MAG: hypothetical protein Harvfovirus15_8 [Harvfovirus sp.]|uniref:Uncharacterized protein n=1 Tax=Harvfovirus sp. TaxID=2487768 RepID=A0A3G5A3K6_9VIRU|nr:MAG: hypothetical protein Harvfovirus15_8 [Harvfovirus sp.]
MGWAFSAFQSREEGILRIRVASTFGSSKAEIKFSYATCIAHKSRFSIYTNVQLTKDIEFNHGSIPHCFTYETMIVHPLTHDFIIFNELNERLYMVRSHYFEHRKESQMIKFDVDPEYDISPFAEVVDTILSKAKS